MSTTTSANQPDFTKLSDALIVLSEELPRLINVDSVALLTSLDTLLQDLRRTIVTKDDLEKALQSKLVGIERRLDSIDLKLSQSLPETLKHLAEDREENVVTKTEQPAQVSQISGSTPPKYKALLQGSQAEGNHGLAHGPLGAFAIILATLIPLFVILVW